MVAVSQSIAKWKIEDVVRSYSAKNDTVYVVNFWATFCKPCIEEIPDFIRIVEKYRTQKVKLLLVSLDLPSFYPAKIASFAKKNKYNTNIVWLNETNADHFCPAIDAKWSGAIPSTIIVNNSTGYRKFTEDQISPEEFEKALKEAIGGNAANKFLAPMNDAEVIDNESMQVSLFGDLPKVGMTFKSADSSVYSIIDGKVSIIIRMDDMKVMIIEKGGFSYIYSNLGTTILKTGDFVKRDQLIGFAKNEFDGNKPTLDLYVTDVADNVKLSKQNFTPRKDLKLTDYSIELNLQEPQ
jgi:thiol-disulfide isomerase/thioredoxin